MICDIKDKILAITRVNIFIEFLFYQKQNVGVLHLNVWRSITAVFFTEIKSRDFIHHITSSDEEQRLQY